jgi:hypothetical protein
VWVDVGGWGRLPSVGRQTRFDSVDCATDVSRLLVEGKMREGLERGLERGACERSVREGFEEAGFGQWVGCARQ